VGSIPYTSTIRNNGKRGRGRERGDLKQHVPCEGTVIVAMLQKKAGISDEGYTRKHKWRTAPRTGYSVISGYIK
jgi:hypothetical protein